MLKLLDVEQLFGNMFCHINKGNTMSELCLQLVSSAPMWPNKFVIVALKHLGFCLFVCLFLSLSKCIIAALGTSFQMLKIIL